MSDENVLTKEIAEQFLTDEDSVDLSEFTAIEDAAAESLSKHAGVLGLDGLTSLSDTAAESLGKHQGWILYLSGVIAVSKLAEHNHQISFFGSSRQEDPGVAKIFDAHTNQFPRADSFKVTTDFREVTQSGFIRTLLGDRLFSDSEGNPVSFQEYEIGNVSLPSGRIVACSRPFENSKPIFAQQVIPGEYPVVFAIGDYPAIACIKFSNGNVSKWEPARFDKPSPEMNELDEPDGFGTDIAEGCFSSPEALNQFLADETDELIDDKILNIYKQIESEVWGQIPGEMTMKEAKPLISAAWKGRLAGTKFRQVANGVGNAILFNTGGDGFHPCYFGLDHCDKVVALVTGWLLELKD